LTIENTQIYAKSCFERRRVPEGMDNWYLIADSSEMWGHHNGYAGAIRMLKSRHDYDAGDTGTNVVKFRPIGPIEKDCQKVDIGIAWDAFSINAPVVACPTKLDSFDGDRDTYFHHAWYGNEPADTKERYTTGHSIVKGHVNRSVGFDFRISAREWDLCCGTQTFNKG
jgi:hypothetical protein